MCSKMVGLPPPLTEVGAEPDAEMMLVLPVVVEELLLKTEGGSSLHCIATKAGMIPPLLKFTTANRLKSKNVYVSSTIWKFQDRKKK